MLELIKESYLNYWHFVVTTVTQLTWHNYLVWLILLSLFCWMLEIFFPWRKNQSILRKDFFLDGFYMFFNFFLFSLIIYNAASDLGIHFFNNLLGFLGIQNLLAFEVMTWPTWLHLCIGFVVRDFVQWWTHRLLHFSPRLWEFHKVHHSVQEMGFAAHLRYHWMENVVYRTIEYIPLAMIGIGLRDFFIIHIITLAVGHLNHSNITFPLGPLKYIFNNPQMHIWHHAKELPAEHKYGVNFGLTLSIWDYLFKTNYIPSNGRDIPLGFENIESFPNDFISQNLHGFKSTKNN